MVKDHDQRQKRASAVERKIACADLWNCLGVSRRERTGNRGHSFLPKQLDDLRTVQLLSPTFPQLVYAKSAHSAVARVFDRDFVSYV